MANKIAEWFLGKKGVATPHSTYGNGKWVALGNQIAYQPVDAADFITEGYEKNDIVYSIINLICDKAIVAPWGVYKVVDESSLKKYKELQFRISGWKENDNAIELGKMAKDAIYLHSKALAPVADNRLDELLKYPNGDQSWSDLLREELIYKLITGNKFLAANLLEAGANMGKPGSLFCLPSHLTSIATDGMFPASATEYRLQMGQLITYPKELILHEKYPSLNFTLLNNLFGMSPLKAAAMIVSRTNEGAKSSATAFKNQGRDGMVYLDDPAVDPANSAAQMGLTKDQWYRDNGDASNRKGIGFTHTKLGFIKFGLSPVDLNIQAQEKADIERFCAVYGVPPVLLMMDHATMNNAEAAEKALTTRAVLPHLISKRDALNRKLTTDWGYKGENVYMDFDMSVYHELQGNNKEMAEYLEKMWWYPLRLKYELAGQDVPDYLEASEIERIYAPRGTIPLSDVGLDTVTNAADNALSKAGLNDYK